MLRKKSKTDEKPSDGGKRQSSRTTVVSKAMRVVSVEARQEVRDKRIQQLEADNYQEEQEATQDDDAYVESDEDTGGLKKKKKTKTSKQSSKTTLRGAPRKIRSLERILMDLNYNDINNKSIKYSDSNNSSSNRNISNSSSSSR
jgi:zinc finger HIT domain-containing protein 1